MNNKKMVIFEGVSGAGKTTIINQLIKENNNIDSINIKMSKLMENVEKTNYIDYTNSKYFLLLEELKNILYEDSKKNIVVFERYYLSSLAHAYAMSIIKNDKDIYDNIFLWYKKNIDNRLKQPFAYIYFNLPIDKATKRIKKRNETVANDIWIENRYMQLCEDYKKKFFKTYEKNVKIFEIDATKSVDEIYDKVLNIIKNI